jgi:hypothetical protein
MRSFLGSIVLPIRTTAALVAGTSSTAWRITPVPQPSRSWRVEIVARAIYRDLMGEDYDEFPWDDENKPSSETVEEAECLAEIAVDALDEHYKADDEHFERAVHEAARRRLQELVRALDA